MLKKVLYFCKKFCYSPLAMGADTEPNGGPKWVVVRQDLNNSPTIPDAFGAISRQITYSKAVKQIHPGQRVAVALGSRGIDRIDQVAKAVVGSLRYQGALPFIVPAMGSHEGATAKGQKEALAKLGIDEDTMGCKIDAGMEVVQLGKTRHGVGVYFSRAAFNADHVVPVGRVKKHTSFTGAIESGLIKLTTVGLGKIEGAAAYHHPAYSEHPTYDNFPRDIEQGFGVIRRRVSVPFGVALVENGLNKLSQGGVIPGADIPQTDRRMLMIANELMPRLPGSKIDILVVEQIGKSISGRGMDTNVINRDYNGSLAPEPEIGTIIVRSVIDGGNANGIGAADIVLQQAVDQIDKRKTELNAQTAGTPEGAVVRRVAECDRAAVTFGLVRTRRPVEEVTMMYIKNTKDIAELWVTQNLIPQLSGEGITIEGEPFSLGFDQRGMLSQTI